MLDDKVFLHIFRAGIGRGEEGYVFLVHPGIEGDWATWRYTPREGRANCILTLNKAVSMMIRRGTIQVKIEGYTEGPKPPSAGL